MIHIAVIIITYCRPQGLSKLLDALQQQHCRDTQRDFRLTAIVVDNDQTGSAAKTIEPFRASPTLAIEYVIERKQGIPVARNAGINAVPEDVEFFCFIDDDEWPGETWIDALLQTQRATKADCVLGAVIPVYPPEAPRWMVASRVFESWQFSDQTPLRKAASNNVLISHDFIKRTKVRFDERMRMTGGSDYLFFQQAVAQGMRIVWSASAPVYEDIPLSRLSWRWIVQRQYRLGNTFSLSERLTGSPQGLAKWILKGIARTGLGFAMLPALPFSPYYGMRAVVHLLRGIGTVAGAFGHAHQEYSPQGLSRDRPAP